MSAEGGSAARIVHDAIDPAINGPALQQVLSELMVCDEVRKAMAAAAKRCGRGQAASEIADYIVGLVKDVNEPLTLVRADSHTGVASRTTERPRGLKPAARQSAARW